MNNLDAKTLEKLMAYADGELDGSDRLEIEALLQANPAAVRVLEELSVLGDCIRIVAETHPVVMPNGVADAVMARIQAEARSQSGAKAQAKPAPVIDLASRRRRTYGLVAGLVAAAAAVVLVARMTNDEAPRAEITPPAVTTALPAAASPSSLAMAPSALALAPSGATAAAAAESPSSVSVILVPSEGETASSIVIWLGEESTVK